MDKQVATILSYVIIAVFVVSFLVDIFVPAYEPPLVIHGLMTALAGATYGTSIRKKKESNGAAEPAGP